MVELQASTNCTYSVQKCIPMVRTLQSRYKEWTHVCVTSQGSANASLQSSTRRWSEIFVTTRTPATNTSYEHHQRTKICHIPTSGHVEMLGSGIAMWQICCRIVVSLSVGGVRSRCPLQNLESKFLAVVEIMTKHCVGSVFPIHPVQ